MQWTNPATGVAHDARHVMFDDARIEACVQTAHARFAAWSRRAVESRAGHLREVATWLIAQRGALARTMATEMGKPVTQGEAEVDKCAWVCRFYADEAATMLAPEPLSHPDSVAQLRFDPLGVVLGVMPWNFPLWQVFRFAAPTLMAGNVCLVKHAPNVPGCAQHIEDGFAAAGCLPGTFSNLFVTEEDVHTLIHDARVAGVSLTGSTRAGRAVAATAGGALKPCLLELGGSDPFVVMADADVKAAAAAIVASRLANAGQSCIAAKRVLVATQVHDALVSALAEAMAEWIAGDPTDHATTLGPMARVDLRDAVAAQVAASVRDGATAVLGGAVPGKPGAWYPATLLTGVGQGMRVFEEEVFGPVIAVTAFDTWSRAVELANATRYGLGACMFGGTPAQRQEFVTRVESGACFLEAFVRSDPRLPFGGIKASGYGRELGRAGILAFVNAKTVCDYAAPPPPG